MLTRSDLPELTFVSEGRDKGRVDKIREVPPLLPFPSPVSTVTVTT